MGTALSERDREVLLAWLRTLIERHGFETYVSAPIIEPTDSFFPDPYTADLKGVRTIARRLFGYAGLSDIEVDVFGATEPVADALTLSEGRLAEVGGGLASIEIFVLGDPKDLPPMLSHEVARAYLIFGSGGAEHPYRSASAPADQSDEKSLGEEIAAAAFYLGFGLLVAIGAERYRAAGDFDGIIASTRWVHKRIGDLKPEEASFLLAVSAVIRRTEAEELKRWRAYLGPNERSSFNAFVKDLRPREAALCESIGLPPREGWPPLSPVHVRPLPKDDWQAPGSSVESTAGLVHPIFRVANHHGDRAAVAASIAGAALTLGSIYAVALIPVAAVVGYFVGRKRFAFEQCSECEARLSASDPQCGQCGGKIVGMLKRGESRLEAEERTQGLSAFGTLAEAQDDAAPRYVLLSVMCPTCAWVPDGLAHWSCDSCTVEMFNTFKHGGQCPGCEKILDDTHCPRCQSVALYTWWWPDA